MFKTNQNLVCQYEKTTPKHMQSCMFCDLHWWNLQINDILIFISMIYNIRSSACLIFHPSKMKYTIHCHQEILELSIFFIKLSLANSTIQVRNHVLETHFGYNYNISIIVIIKKVISSRTSYKRTLVHDTSQNNTQIVANHAQKNVNKEFCNKEDSLAQRFFQQNFQP